MNGRTLEILTALAAVHFAGDAASKSGREAVIADIRNQVRTMSRQDLVDAVMVLSERFAQAMEATREHVELLAITEFGMHPHAVDRLNLPTMMGSLMGLSLPLVREEGCCATCAFKQGSAANQCVPTVSDALECIDSREKFMCHEGVHDGDEPVHVCRGWAQAMKLVKEFA